MRKTTLAWCAAVLIGGAGFFGACNDTITGENCRVKCQDVDNTCVQKCNDDQCKTVCATDLDNCSASCDSVMSTPPDGGR
jgi:hypothetical protein